MYIGVYKSLCGIGVKINMKYKIYFEYLSFLLICLYFYVILYVVICILNFVFFIMKKKILDVLEKQLLYCIIYMFSLGIVFSLNIFYLLLVEVDLGLDICRIICFILYV